MPNITTQGVTPIELSGFSVTLMDTGGRTSTVGLDKIDPSVTLGQMQAWGSAVGRSSNAAVIAENYSQQRRISKGSARPFDDSESSVASKGILVFEDAELNIKEVTVPAPDLSWFQSLVAKTPDYGAPATPPTPEQVLGQLITATLAIINAGDPAGTFAYLKGYVQTPGRKTPAVAINVTAVEPGATSVPGDAPGV
jgi:hypothetical protein